MYGEYRRLKSHIGLLTAGVLVIALTGYLLVIRWLFGPSLVIDVLLFGLGPLTLVIGVVRDLVHRRRQGE